MNTHEPTTPTTEAETSDDPTDADDVQAVPQTLPASVNSAEAKLIYLYVRQRGDCTPAELADALRLTKLSLFPHLRTLVDRGLLRREEADRYVAADAIGAVDVAEAAD